MNIIYDVYNIQVTSHQKPKPPPPPYILLVYTHRMSQKLQTFSMSEQDCKHHWSATHTQ